MWNTSIMNDSIQTDQVATILFGSSVGVAAVLLLFVRRKCQLPVYFVQWSCWMFGKVQQWETLWSVCVTPITAVHGVWESKLTFMYKHQQTAVPFHLSFSPFLNNRDQSVHLNTQRSWSTVIAQLGRLIRLLTLSRYTCTGGKSWYWWKYMVSATIGGDLHSFTLLASDH